MLLCGTETEFGMIGRGEFIDQKKRQSDEDADKMLDECFSELLGKHEQWLTNGGLFYVDNGNPEYATPECIGPRDLLIYEKAGEKIVDNFRRDCLRKFEAIRYARSRLAIKKLKIYKKNRGFLGSTYGSHENYYIRDDLFRSLCDECDHSLSQDVMLAFLMTRQIICGAGWLTPCSGTVNAGFYYQISQRADFMEFPVGGGTTSTRAIINCKDEDLENSDSRKRLHLILGDSNMAEWALYLKIGTTSLILMMLEDHRFHQNFPYKTADAKYAIREVSRDLTCKKAVIGLRGKSERVSALEVQKFFLEAAKNWYQYRKNNFDSKTSAEIEDILQKWDFIIRGLDDNPKKLWPYLDWVAKWKIFEGILKKKGTSWREFMESFDQPRRPDSGLDELCRILKAVDYQYHDISDDGFYNQLTKKNVAARIITDEEIKRAMHQPPRNTRAAIRSRFVKWLRRKQGKIVSRHQFSWDSLRCDFAEFPIKPFQTALPECFQYIFKE